MLDFLKKITKNRFFYIFIVICYALIVFLPFLSKYASGDDTIFHLVNIDIYSKISIFDKIVPLYANNLGWGVGIFYPPFPHILGALILRIVRIFGFGNIMAIKLVKLLIILFSGIFMYILTIKIYKDKQKGMLGAIFYLTSSYFYVDIFIRDALNESMIFIFIPLIVLGLYYIFNEKNQKMFYICFITGYVGMIYTHLLLTMWLTIVLFFFLIFYIKNIFKKEVIKPFIISTLIVIGLTGTFVFPLLEHMIAKRWFIPAYKLAWAFPIRGYIIPDYYKSSSGGLLFINFSYIIIILTIIGIINLFTKKKYTFDKKFLIGILVFSVVSMLLSSQLWFWKTIPQFFSSIQFAWRIAAFSTFGICLFAVSGLDNVYNLFKDKYKYVMTIILIVILSIFHYQHLSITNFNTIVEYNKDYKNYYTTNDYFPNKSTKNINEIKKYDSNKIQVLSGNTEYKILKNKVPNMTFKINNLDGKAKLQLPRFYYFGYKIIDKNGKELDYKESKIGLIEVNISKNGTYELKYVGTKSYQIAKIIKIILILLLIFIPIIKKRTNKV